MMFILRLGLLTLRQIQVYFSVTVIVGQKKTNIPNYDSWKRTKQICTLLDEWAAASNIFLSGWKCHLILQLLKMKQIKEEFYFKAE